MNDLRKEVSTHHDLWAGVDLKVTNAGFHYQAMAKALEPPEQTAYTVVLESAGAIVGGNWHTAFYAHLDALLSAARSVPELIKCCFGVDKGHPMVRDWFQNLDPAEQQRRQDFWARFEPYYHGFRALPLGNARHISEHRTGAPPVTASVTGRFGITYFGSPTKTIPMTESRELPAEFAWMQKRVAVRPTWSQFEIDGKPLFETCDDYLKRASELITKARALAEEVHGDSKLTSPPTEM
jgi:hypothetical protein